MTTVLVIPGSHRHGSLNLALARAAAAVAPDGVTVDIATMKGIPLYDGDVEAQGIPGPVDALKERIVAADALLLVSPEYNNSVPGPLKNTIDWLSRPQKDAARIFGDRPVGVIGASVGPGGTRFAQSAWLPVFRVLGSRFFSGKTLYIADGGKVFDAEGKLIDEKIKQVLTAYMAGFAKFAGAVESRPS